MMLQVGPGCGYVLTVGGFNRNLSTLGDAMTAIDSGYTHNGMKFSTKYWQSIKKKQTDSSHLYRDLDQDKMDDRHCALQNTGGWHPALKIYFGPPTANLWSNWSPQKCVKCNKWN